MRICVFLDAIHKQLAIKFLDIVAELFVKFILKEKAYEEDTIMFKLFKSLNKSLNNK